MSIETHWHAHEGKPSDKWLHYLPIYDRHIPTDRPIRMLEIGVQGGGMLEVWRKALHPGSIVHGIDIDPACAAEGVTIGDQADPSVLRDALGVLGGLDVVVGDGSHVGKDQRASFEYLYPRLAADGVYIIEDTHTSYWGSHEGGWRQSGTAIEDAKNLVDKLHGHWSPGHGGDTFAMMTEAIHFYDSMIVIQKRARTYPTRKVTGGGVK